MPAGTAHASDSPTEGCASGVMPAWAVLDAPASWQSIGFMSDLHLHAGDPHTFAAWAHHMERMPCDALFILGDLLEVWVGDDELDHPGEEGRFWAEVVAVLRAATTRVPVYFMPGNRDFLAGSRFLNACGMQALSDPTVLAWQGQRWLLSHGDALCTADLAYQKFRAEVRAPGWQAAFLAQPLDTRMATARSMRQASEAQKQRMTEWVDVDPQAARQWLELSHCQRLIHGHTHQAAVHTLGNGLQRHVLSDWDARSTPPRLEWIRAEAPDIAHPQGRLSRLEIYQKNNF
jgi:UDP-2,3-diacylglucosamine hydrolase